MRNFLLVIPLIIALTLSSCSTQSSVPTSKPENILIEPTAISTAAPAVEDQASLILELQHADATIDLVDSVIQDFFTPEGNVISVNGEDIQVFEYDDIEAMELEAKQVAPDGSSVGTSMMMWVGTPHFYKAGKIIILYIGDNQSVLDLLDNTIGPQFAGQ